MSNTKTFVRMDGICKKCHKFISTEVTWAYYQLIAGSTELGPTILAEAFLNADHRCITKTNIH